MCLSSCRRERYFLVGDALRIGVYKLNKNKGRKTKEPGIWMTGPNQFRVRVRWKDPRTGLEKDAIRVIEDATFPEAVKLKLEMLEKLQGSQIENDKNQLTVGDFAQEWFDKLPGHLAPGTFEKYRTILECHFLPAFGNWLLSSVTLLDLESWRDAQRQKYAANTVNDHIMVAKLVLRRAYALQLIGHDVTFGWRAVPVTDTRICFGEPNALTEDECRRFLSETKLRYPQHYPIILVMVTTSVRISEARALEWRDVQWDQDMIIVRRRLSAEKLIDGLKGGQKFKTVPIVPELRQVLRDMKKCASSELLFPSRTGGYRARSGLDKPFKVILKAAEIRKRFTPHGTRRTANDLYRGSGSVVTKAILGHTTDAMHEHYSTVGSEEKHEAASRAFENVLGSRKEGKAPEKLNKN